LISGDQTDATIAKTKQGTEQKTGKQIFHTIALLFVLPCMDFTIVYVFAGLTSRGQVSEQMRGTSLSNCPVNVGAAAPPVHRHKKIDTLTALPGE
jgi:hypothetical protein